jgi:hypothetical protein
LARHPAAWILLKECTDAIKAAKAAGEKVDPFEFNIELE